MDSALALAAGEPVGMGFFGQSVDDDLENFELAAHRLRLVELFWRPPDPELVSRARRAGDVLVGWQVGSVGEARAAEDAGCDLVVAQGVEAGGHVRGTTPLGRLLDEACGAVAVPVVAAGGISSAQGVADAIAGGAAAVRVGTRFVATIECNAHDRYKEALVQATSAEDTEITTTFCSGWRDAPHRVLVSAIRAAHSIDEHVIGWTDWQGTRTPVERYSISPPTRATGGHIEAMALYAGTGVGDIAAVQPAGSVVAELTSALA
jgi:NAD(P)H-dependent flavin oxidoreductase YrpB (nitropropane dioxygenase family)